ncbi:uncharacterized protein LOC135332060 isoform X1 [Halichondria panicea]|uniref:uncharacterized protein LOC135332060 isoform X1 n=1 Tax=Halichondria panicea TaxID=6063 RepID=UPI00312B31C6
MVCCRCKKGLCTNCCSTRCSNQASSSTQCAALLPNPLALARGLTLRLKRCVPASQLVPPPPKRKCSRNLLGRPPSPYHEGGHKNCPLLFWRNQLVQSVDIPWAKGREGRLCSLPHLLSSHKHPCRFIWSISRNHPKKCINFGRPLSRRDYIGEVKEALLILPCFGESI